MERWAIFIQPQLGITHVYMLLDGLKHINGTFMSIYERLFRDLVLAPNIHLLLISP